MTNTANNQMIFSPMNTYRTFNTYIGIGFRREGLRKVLMGLDHETVLLEFIEKLKHRLQHQFEKVRTSFILRIGHTFFGDFQHFHNLFHFEDFQSEAKTRSIPAHIQENWDNNLETSRKSSFSACFEKLFYITFPEMYPTRRWLKGRSSCR